MPTTLTLSQISAQLVTAGSGTVIGQTNRRQVGYLLDLILANYSSAYATTTFLSSINANQVTFLLSSAVADQRTAGVLISYAQSVSGSI